MLNKLAIPNLTAANIIESVQSVVSVEEIEVIMDGVLSENTAKPCIFFNCYFNIDTLKMKHSKHLLHQIKLFDESSLQDLHIHVEFIHFISTTCWRVAQASLSKYLFMSSIARYCNTGHILIHKPI